jgi:hypothetical protein
VGTLVHDVFKNAPHDLDELGIKLRHAINFPIRSSTLKGALRYLHRTSGMLVQASDLCLREH